jgi:SH3 domain protein
MIRRILFACLVLGCAGPALAEARWVTDQMEALLRSGTSTQHSIVRVLRSGARVETLEQDPDTGYTRVRLQDGTEGWILTRFLDGQPSARDRLAAANERVGTLESRVAELTAQLQSVSGERAELGAEREDLGEEVTGLRSELERIQRVSASALQLEQSNRDLRTRLASAEQATDALEAEVAELKSASRRDWFLAGAGVLAGGIILGLVLPRLRLRRRSRWGEL